MARLLLRFPVASTAALGSALLSVSPAVHRHLAGAAWLQIVAPLPMQHWQLWETRPGIMPLLYRWALSGAVCLTLPACLDHLYTCLRTGPSITRACELVLFAENAWRIVVLCVFAAVRTSLTSSEGVKAMDTVHDAVRGVLDAATHEDMPYKRLVEDLCSLCVWAQFSGSGLAPRFAAQHRCFELSGKWPRHLWAYLKVLGAQLGCGNILQRWLPLLWHLAIRDVGQVAVFADLVLWGPFGSLGAYLTRSAFPGFHANNAQIQQAFCNCRDFLCSVIRGARAVRILALHLS